jgi:shikimate 5-dehydrogenase
MQVFPKWAAILGINAQLVGYDCPIHAPPEDYLAIVQHIHKDPLSRGALVTTHKIDLLAATRHLFASLDPFSELCGEISCISKRDGGLRGHAKDPISSGLAWQAFVPKGHWGNTGAQVLCLGAGGAAIAISVYAATTENAADRPQKFIAVDRSATRLEELKAVHAKLHTDIAFEYVCSENPRDNDEVLAALPAGSLVINATGMGKDRQGSPITDAGIFPQSGLVWELNYRGELDFMHQARRQAAARGLTVEDGWVYFLHGWTQVIAEVFDLQLTPTLFARLAEAATSLRP